MKTYLKRAFQLSDSGVKGLAKSIWSFFLYYVSFVPPMICVFLFADRLLNGNTGKPVVYLLFMLAATLVMYLVINYNYKTTYDETYQESANLRIDLAEQLSKLPLSYFSKHNLSDLAQTIMADVASIEHAFANAVANSIGFAIYFLVISVALLIMNWKLGLCVLLPVLTSASVLFLTKKLQVRDVNKHYDKLRDISESFQNAIELNQEIKSYGLKEKVEAQMDQQLDESENLQWKAQITQTIPVTIGQTLSILPIGITATVGLSMLASGQVSILILLGYIIMAAKLSGAMGGVLLYLTEIFYLDARIARIGEIKNHELQGGEKAVLSDFNVEIKDVCFSYQKDTQVIRHLATTTSLVGMAILWIIVLTVPISLLCARKRNRLFDQVTRGITICGICVPTFWLGFLLLLFFAIHLKWFSVLPSPGWRGFLLPSFALAVPSSCSLIRIMRSSLLAELSSDYVRFAKARGLSANRILVCHILRNALPPVVTIFFQQFGFLIAGGAVIESVFSIKGIGTYLVDSVIAADTIAVSTCIVVIAAIFVVANFMADIINRLLCPWMVREENDT